MIFENAKNAKKQGSNPNFYPKNAKFCVFSFKNLCTKVDKPSCV